MNDLSTAASTNGGRAPAGEARPKSAPKQARRRVVDFDIDRYLRASKRLDLSGIRWEEVPQHRLSDGDVMVLHYMMDIETHTVIYLRDLLATRAAHDPHVTAFLCCWVYEELWHGEASPRSPPRSEGRHAPVAVARAGLSAAGAAER